MNKNRKGPTVSRTYRIKKTVVEKLEKMSDETGVSRTEIIENLILKAKTNENDKSNV